jgi:hypothetical protein
LAVLVVLEEILVVDGLEAEVVVDELEAEALAVSEEV